MGAGESRVSTYWSQIDLLQAVGGQNSSEFIADGTLSAAGDDDGHLRFVKRPSLKWRSGMMPFVDWFCTLPPTLSLQLKEWKILVLDRFCRLQQTLRLRPKKLTILVLGLKNREKSELLHKLHNACIGNVKLQAFDLGSHWIVPRVCKDYYAKVDDIVYMVDVTETEELAKSKEEISALWSVDLLTDVPFSILTRYCDDQTAFEDELCNLLGLNKGKVNLDERAIKVFMCKTVQDMGVEEVFKITR